jgi:two-component system cell cycle sensor histidine kinase/response regulator CckA
VTADVQPSEIALPGLEPEFHRLVRLLTRAGRVLGSSLDLERTLRQLLDLLVPALADACVLHLVGRDGRTVENELFHAIPEAAGALAEYTRLFPAADRPNSPIGHALRTRQSELLDVVTAADIKRFGSTPEQRELIGRLRIRSLLTLPLSTPEQIWGGLALLLVEGGDPGRRFGPAETALLEEIASRAALAVSHATMFRRAENDRAAAVHASQLTDRLQRVTAALGAAETPDAVYDVIISAGAEALGAIAAGVLEASADGATLHLRRIVGFEQSVTASYVTIPLRPLIAAGPGARGWLPVHDAWRSGEPLWIPDLASWERAYGFRPALLGPNGDASWGVLPLRGGGEMIGVLTLTFPEAHAVSEQERAFAAALANQCSQALERARLRTREALALRAAARAENSLTTAMSQVSDVIVTFDADWRFDFINAAAAAQIRKLGLEPDRLRGQVVWERMPELRGSPLAQAITRCRAEQLPVHDEEYFPRLATWYAMDFLPSAHGVTMVARDVTATRELADREARLRRFAAVIESSHDAIISKDLEGTVTSWNPSAERIFGYTADEMVGQAIYRLIPEALHAEERDLLRRLAAGEMIETFETERTRKDGRGVVIAVTISPVLDSSGAVTGFSSIKRDVTEQRRVQRALQESEARLQAVLQQLPSGVFIAEAPSGRLLLANAQVEVIWRHPPIMAADVPGYREYHGFHDDGRPYEPHEWPLARVLSTGEAVLGEEIRILRGDGTTGWISANAAPLRDEAGAVIGGVAVFSDITAQRQTEERLRQSAKMEAIGRLAGGLAHDFNNQLSALSGFAQFVARDPGLGGRARQDLLQVQLAAERMAGLTRQLLAFSRQQILTPETIDLNAAVADAYPLLQRLIGSQIDMRVETPATPIWIRADRSQLLQVLMNLAINARDAMPDGGTLRIGSRVRQLPAEQLHAAAEAVLSPGRYAEIVVEDTGTGIDPSVLPNIFEPFFTTKEVGKGTGLGLATVHGIVSQSQGVVWADTALGRGTTFHVLLPVAAAPGAAAPGTSSARGGRTGGRVLVVEDEDVVRQMVTRSLTEVGFDVVHARHGGEALARLAELEGKVDAILSDVVMPVMGGRELALQLRGLYPDIPTVWVSGYPRESLATGESFAGGAAFLQKPVPPELLVDTLRTAIERRPPHQPGL